MEINNYMRYHASRTASQTASLLLTKNTRGNGDEGFSTDGGAKISDWQSKDWRLQTFDFERSVLHI